ncbi:MAG: GreA/GreB family elongation factor [Phycisphaerae bacterium]|nr:GreA/GreB family elongation factor [Phycisphaerae bacterium]
MTSRFFAVGATLLLLCAAGVAQETERPDRGRFGRGQGGPPGPGGPNFEMLSQRLADQLDLDDQQRASYDEIVASFRERFAQSGQGEQMRDLMRQMREARQAGDDALAEDLRRKMDETRRAGETLREEFLSQVEPILRPEQVERLATIRERLGNMERQRFGNPMQQIEELRDVLRLDDQQNRHFDELLADMREQMRSQRGMGAELRPLIEELRRHKRDAELAQWYTRLLARPRVSPFVLTELARLVESGKLKGEFPTPVQRAMALIELSVYLQEERVGDSVMARAQQRLTDLLLDGEPPLVQTMIAEADIPALRSIRAMLQRGVDDRIDLVVTDIVLDMGGDVFRSEALPFWMEEKIWTTRAGLAKRESELNELKEKKIPANAEAIAKAASYGDLSENAEWEQAIEEQRQLTNAASEMDKELRMAALLENAAIPDDTVCPGTTVTFRDRRTGDQQTVTILGPWDAKDDHTISYKAPLARGMLGKSTGQTAIIELPSGTQDVEILKIDMAKLA